MSIPSAAIAQKFCCVDTIVLFSSTVIHKRPGDDVVLPCRRDCALQVLEWTRKDVTSDSYVFFYRNERSYEKYQIDAYKSRVYLKDPNVDQGDYSVIVKNLTVSDTAVYCCRVLCDTSPPGERVYVSLVVSPEVQYNSGRGREISSIALLTLACVITVVLL